MLQVCATRDAMSTLALKIKVIHVKNISQNMLRTTDGEIKIEQQEKKKKQDIPSHSCAKLFALLLKSIASSLLAFESSSPDSTIWQ